MTFFCLSRNPSTLVLGPESRVMLDECFITKLYPQLFVKSLGSQFYFSTLCNLDLFM